MAISMAPLLLSVLTVALASGFAGAHPHRQTIRSQDGINMCPFSGAGRAGVGSTARRQGFATTVYSACLVILLLLGFHRCACMRAHAFSICSTAT